MNCRYLVAGCLSSALLFSQSDSQGGRIERIKVYGKALEGNLAGDPAERDVSIYLPPSYQARQNRRYPVIYMLHGFTDNDAKWFGITKHWINLPAVIDKALASGGAGEMIVVMPDAFTRYQGSMYSNSVTTGNWEEFVAKELVSYIDTHYRTIPNAASRGLAGHSMGGYGTLRIAMKQPGVFSSIYALNPCCLMPNMDLARAEARMAKADAVRDVAEIEKADFGTKAALASGAAWSPNPKNPPLFLDLPWKNGEFQPLILAKWAANAPLAMVDQYLPFVKKLSAIGFDAGTKEAGISAGVKALDQILTANGVEHTSEIYEGDHTNRVAERIETTVLPFFSKNLSFSEK